MTLVGINYAGRAGPAIASRPFRVRPADAPAGRRKGRRRRVAIHTRRTAAHRPGAKACSLFVPVLLSGPVGGATEDQMNDRALSDMVSQMDAELARAEPDLPLHPEETRRLEIMRALALGLGNFERMRAHDVHLLAARMGRR